MKRLSLALLLALVALSSGAREAGKSPAFEVREAGGIPYLWMNGIPYFTRFQETDHEILNLAGVLEISGRSRSQRRVGRVVRGRAGRFRLEDHRFRGAGRRYFRSFWNTWARAGIAGALPCRPLFRGNSTAWCSTAPAPYPGLAERRGDRSARGQLFALVARCGRNH